MDRDVEARLRAHVEATLVNGVIPAGDRDDVGMELFGHLAEAWSRHEAAGLSPTEAVERAIAEFGGPAEVGRAFQRTYHSRLWASTIGDLLPPTTPTADVPPIVTWVVRAATAVATVTLFGASVLAMSLSPIRAIVTEGSAIAGAGAMLIAAQAMRRQQDWGRAALLGGAGLQAVLLFILLTGPDGAVTVSLNGVIALALVVHMIRGEHVLRAWVAGSRPIPTRQGAIVAVALGVWVAGPLVVPRMPDPTQLGPSDISVVATVRCANSGRTGSPMRVDTTVDVTWKRPEWLPDGLAGAGRDRTDSVVVDAGVPYDGITVTDPAAGVELANDYQSGAVPAELEDELIVANLPASEMRPGRTIRIASTATGNGPELPPVVFVAYGHLDRFVLRNLVACGQKEALGERHAE